MDRKLNLMLLGIMGPEDSSCLRRLWLIDSKLIQSRFLLIISKLSIIQSILLRDANLKIKFYQIQTQRKTVNCKKHFQYYPKPVNYPNQTIQTTLNFNLNLPNTAKTNYSAPTNLQKTLQTTNPRHNKTICLTMVET